MLRQGSLLFPRRERLWLPVRTRSGSAFAGCAVAQRRLQGLIEQILLVAAALLPLHAHRVGSDCSLLLNSALRRTIRRPATTSAHRVPLPASCSGSPGEAQRSPRVRRCCFAR